jgi:S-DNA-T family DNA segregation ATPase FtsK/SpoIIIE
LLQKYEKSNIDSSEEHKTNMEIIKQTLSEFNIEAEPQSYVQGPTITRYEVMMPTGVSARKVLGCVDQLQMRLASASGVRVQAPIPGKNLVGIEVANAHPEKVGLREVLELAAAKGPSKPNSLMFALGKDIVGNPICDNLAKGPHYLVAGSTGAGKSVCLNAMIISLIMRYSPEELRLFLVDPKTVEFSAYKHLPHLMIDEIITSARKAKEMLKWAHVEMERRFKVLYDCDAIACRDIDDYNSRIASDTVAKMPRIVIIIDELADLMMQENKKELEGEICSIAQKARAVGIHLVVATQRPSVDVVTGLIKTNLPSRIAFKTTSHTDSQTILDRGGAEQLLGNGDMLYKNAQMPYTERYQGAFIDNFEVNNVVQYIIKNNQAYFDDELQEYLEKVSNPEPEPAPEEVRVVDENPENDATFLTALWFAITKTTVSISSLQRRFSFGFSRAGRIIDLMDRMGYLAPSEGGNKPRKVLLSAEEYLQKYGEAPTGDGRL